LERTRRKRIGIINGDRGAPLNITLEGFRKHPREKWSQPASRSLPATFG
jgi:hypothetical protein